MADITAVAIATSFVYVVVILDAWSRKVVGYAIGRSIDVRLTLAARRTAVEKRGPPPGSTTTRTAVRNTRLDAIGRPSPNTVSSDQWAPRQSL